MSKNKPIVLYLAYQPLGINLLKSFIKSYINFKSGYDHELLICFKKFTNVETIEEWSSKVPFNFIRFIDNEKKNDFDIGSYLRVSEQYQDRLILFLGTYTNPKTNNWLRIFVENYKEKSILGATGSYASIPSMFFKFYYNQYTKFQQIKWGLQHLLKVKLFPNPHIRTTGFLILAKDLLSIKYDRNKLIKKIECNYFEGGRHGMSQQLISRRFNLFIANSDNNIFSIKDWKKSKTYCLENQEKLIFIDNRTNEYHNASPELKKKMNKLCWGSN